MVDVLTGVARQAGIAADPFIDTDGVSMADPAYNATHLYELYKQLEAGAAVAAGPADRYAEPIRADGGGFGGTVSATDVEPWPPAAATAWNLTGAGATRARLQLATADNRTVVLSITNLALLAPSSGTAAVYRVSLPWEAGVRFRLPAVAVPIDSFASMHRLLARGGPASVYCPAGSGWPTPVPAGFYSITTGADAAAAPGAATNLTRDAIAVVEPGYFSVAGVKHPCHPGSWRDKPGGAVRTCEWCPAGSECPLACAKPQPCGQGTFAPAGSGACLPCPGAAAASNVAEAAGPKTQTCFHARACCGM
jgi:hypothetical protein